MSDVGRQTCPPTKEAANKCEAKVLVEGTNRKVHATAMTTNPKPDDIRGKAEGVRPEKGADGGESATSETNTPESRTEIMEIDDDGSSISLDSVFGSSFNARSIMTDEGHINHSKMMGLALPTLDVSRLRDMAATSFPELPHRAPRPSHKNKTASLTHSTPVTHVVNSKTRKLKKSAGDNPPLDE